MTETSIQSAAPTQSRGRPPAASRGDVLALAMHRYLRGRRIDVHAIAGELGLGRTTIYRWFGSRDELIGETLVRAAEPLLERARGRAREGRSRPSRHARSLQPRSRRGAGATPVHRNRARGGATRDHLKRRQGAAL